jgi:HSP20 family protein
MARNRWEPWTELARIRRDVAELLGDRPGGWIPAADVDRDDEGITVKLDLPGLSPADVNVELRDGTLVISGERKQESEERREGAVTRERIFGSFVRTLALPARVQPADVHASFANGELTVKVDLPAQAKGEKIEIESGEPAAV